MRGVLFAAFLFTAGFAVGQAPAVMPGPDPASRRSTPGDSFSRSRVEPGMTNALDSVFVETYHVLPDSAGGPPLVTYRIYVDMTPGHELQMVYGDERNQLEIATTTEFFNDPAGVRYATDLPSDGLTQFPQALDSWLTIGAASNGHWAVPLALDNDGSLLTCPPYPGMPGHAAHGKPPRSLCMVDGLMAMDSVKQVVHFQFDPGYLGRIRGNQLHTMDGAWAVLGGTKGVTDRNVVLIAQISTTGVLSYTLNLQLRGPDRQVVKYVATATDRIHEILYPGLHAAVPLPY
jgi:hypothetical protein